MNHPFRSELEQLREELRRCKERAAELEQAKAALPGSASRMPRRHGVGGAAVLAAALVAISAFSLGRWSVSAASRDVAADPAVRETESVVRREDPPSVSPSPSPRASRPTPSVVAVDATYCAPGDPLCTSPHRAGSRR